VDPLLERLAVRQAAAQADVDRLRTQIAALTEELAAAEETLSRLEITHQTVLAVLAEDEPQPSPSPPPDTVASPTTDTIPIEATADYRRILAVLAHTDRGLHAKDLCEALDTGTEARHVEAMRAKLKRLVRRGVLTEPEPGLFVMAQPTNTTQTLNPTDSG
jgi:hypothetical protein